MTVVGSSEVNIPVLLVPRSDASASPEPYQYLFHPDYTPEVGGAATVGNLQAIVLRQAESVPRYLMPLALWEAF